MTGKPPAMMAGASNDPIGSQRCGRTPEWMLSKDEMGQSMVLVLRCRVPENVTDDPQLPEPFIIGTSVELAIGVKEARSVKASREGRGTRYLLRTNSRNIVSKLTKMTELTDGTPIEIFPHPTLNTVQGMVYEPDSINTDETVIAKNLKSQDVQAVRRIKKRVDGKLKNTPLLILSFHGTELPDHVYFGLLRIEVRAYYPSPLLCFNCGTYGHPRKSCSQPGICLRCSSPLHLAEGEQCENTPHCFHCRKDHSIRSRECPKYKEEDKIIHIKVDRGISFGEARRIYNEENRRETIARVIQNQLKQEIATKDQLIASLQKQVAELAKELASIKSALREPQQPLTQTTSPKETQSSATTSKTQHKSRKDESFVSPPAKRKDNRDKGTDNSYRTRSRSNKCELGMSATGDLRGRISNHSDASSSGTSLTCNNG